MSTGTEIINRAFRKLRRKAAYTLLDGAITISAASLTLDSVESVGPGSLLEIDQEVVQVTSVARDTRVATVVRAALGTTAVAHLDNATVVIDPEFFRIEAFDMINECLRDVYPKIYQIGAEAVTYNSSLIGLNLPTLDGGYPLAVQAQVDSTSKNWEFLADWQYMPQADTGDFAQGKALMLRVSLPSNAKIRVLYPKPFTALATETDDLIINAGLKDYMLDLPYYYIVGYSMPSREINRSQSQAAENHQRSQDVPGFLALRTGEWYLARYTDKLEEARRRLLEELRHIRRTGYGS